ncbi:YpjP family protein [Paenisporosarcina sp. TG20]|uniref:YpjP family protein n=1 Tax=Paenisporosarcina sp. TG20 TaxID=1211706 RepID=UPI0002F54754|nr:YpjP family protein [Paenisporosarcina sp. TG20]
MRNWIQKSLVIIVAFLTFGIISPTHILWENLLVDKVNQKSISTHSTQPSYTIELTDEQPNSFVEDTIIQAKEQSLLKFGSRIGPVITNEFDQIIFPKIQEAIEFTLFNLDDESLKTLVISEKPTGNNSEKMFHIYDSTSGYDIIRFHVRTDRKPQDGYFFNFHYHSASDQFFKHYQLGDIYWSKNMPPKWMS